MACAMVLHRSLAEAKDPGAPAARVHARRELDTLTASWPTELRNMFLARPDLRRYMEEEN
jgi:hypothetical protein